ncbi:hypothetical protein SPSYN_01433 [Sporotomaculum syntrophicum]|uniref:DUF2680 domain-containing protein n=1 Tax=Sporotomaculum syntrophicum TaxID=182264 RepID=A0A9D2WRJ5_9FIRM|nr:DUF2680 domain-containing protein [Sporotomaculum syntrophicum]KAF1085297.1 hypothetical protein SPSYN_01433 [Sporotomaculum syntrophicum]
MKNLQKLLVMAIVVALIGAAGAAYAAVAKTPAEITAELTGKTVSELYQERSEGKTYGAIANEDAKLDEFQAQMLEQKKIVLEQRVCEGSLTQEQADNIYNTIQSRQENCAGDGTGIRGRCGLGKGNGLGMGNGNYDGNVSYREIKNGAGNGLGNGFCKH